MTVNFQITLTLVKIFLSIFVFNVCLSKISVFIPKNSKQNTEQNRTRKFGFATEQNRTEHGLKILDRTQNRTEREKLCVLSPLVHRGLLWSLTESYRKLFSRVHIFCLLLLDAVVMGSLSLYFWRKKSNRLWTLSSCICQVPTFFIVWG